MDLEQYIANYSGHTKIKRLVFIAQHDTKLAKQATKLAIAELKKGINTQMYKEVAENCAKKFGAEEFPFDEQWIIKVDTEAQRKIEKLELELNSYKTNMIKESIRTAHNDIGDFYYGRGDFQNALKSYLRARDYNTTPKHVLTMCLNIIKVSIEMGNYALVAQYVGRAEQVRIEDQDIVTQSKLKVASALAELDAKKYKSVAQKLLREVDIAIGSNFNDVITSQDIAIFAGMTALATFDRKEILTKVLQNNVFKSFVELVPQVREMISDFYESKYSSMITYLNKLTPELKLDVFFHEHINGLYEKIRSKALIQYVSPFTSVDLKKMATVFNTSVEALEKDIEKLVADKQIKARIDSHNKILYARATDQRNTTFQQVMDFGDNYLRDTESHILRMNMKIS